MDKLGAYALRAYMTFRNPKFFLIVLCTYIGVSLFAHFGGSYDPDFGFTNLCLSIEASTASAVLMMVAERTATVQEEMAKVQREQLSALLEMAQAERVLMQDHVNMLNRMRENDSALLDVMKQVLQHLQAAQNGQSSCDQSAVHPDQG